MLRFGANAQSEEEWRMAYVTASTTLDFIQSKAREALVLREMDREAPQEKEVLINRLLKG